MNSPANIFWTTENRDPQIENARETMYTHLIKMRTHEINNALSIKKGKADYDEWHLPYLERHPEFKHLKFPSTFYFKILHDRQCLHWAIILKEENYSVYFINVVGHAFDKLEFKSYKVAKRQLRKNKFLCNSNVRCPYLPVLPFFVNLSAGRKSTPYSKGNLWRESPVRPRKKLYTHKQNKNSLLKELFLFFLRYIGCIIFFYVYMRVIGWI